MANVSGKVKVDSEGLAIGLSPKEIVEFLNCAIDANQPVFLWGPPGVAKSALMRVVAKSRGWGLVDFRALMRDVVDLNGIPSASEDGKYTSWLRPNFIPEEGNDKFPERGIFFIDELNAAPPSMQAVCYQIVHDRMSGEHRLHPGWIPMGAGNNDTDGAVTSKMPTPLKSRFLHCNIALEKVNSEGVQKLVNQGKWAEDWIEWGRDEGNIHPLVLAYHRSTAGADLYAFSKQAQTFPCLRTWEFVSNVLKTKPSGRMLLPLLAGCIGEAYAPRVYAFVQDSWRLPDLDLLLKNPETTELPKDGGQKYALICTLAAKLGGMETKEFNKMFPRALTYVERMSSEFQVMLITDIHQLKKDELKVSKEFKQWACGPVGALISLTKEMDRV